MSDEMEWTGILQPYEALLLDSVQKGSCPVDLYRTSVRFSSKEDLSYVLSCTESDDGIMKHFWVTDGKAVSHCVFGRPKIMSCVEGDKQKPVTVVTTKASKCLVSDDKKTVWFSSDQSTFHIDDISNRCTVNIVDEEKDNCAVSQDGTKLWFKDCGSWRLDHKWIISVTKCSFSDDRKAKKRIVQCSASQQSPIVYGSARKCCFWLLFCWFFC